MNFTQTGKTRFARALAIASLGCVLLGFAREANASSDYPAALKAALDQQFPNTRHCVPQCTACHNTVQGGPKNINSFGLTLEHFGLLPGNAAIVVIVLQELAKASPPFDTDKDGTSDLDELDAGDSPSIAGPAGVGQICPAVTDDGGCGAHIAPVPPKDRLSLFPALLTGFAVIGARRWKQPQRARRAH